MLLSLCVSAAVCWPYHDIASWQVFHDQVQELFILQQPDTTANLLGQPCRCHSTTNKNTRAIQGPHYFIRQAQASDLASVQLQGKWFNRC